MLAGVVVGGMTRPALGDAGRVPDRLRVGPPRRGPAVEPEPVLAVLPSGSSSSSCSSADGLFTRSRGLVERVRARRAAVEPSRRRCSSSRRDPRRLRLADDGDLLRHGAHLGVDRRCDLRLRRELGRALVRAHQLLRVGVWAAGVLSIPERRSRRRCRTSSTSSRRRRSERAVARDRGAVGGAFACSSACRSCGCPASPPASRRSRCSDHEQHPPLLREDRAGAQHVSSVPETTDSCRRRSARARHRRGVRVPAEPLGRQLRATREDPRRARGRVSIYRQRLAAFALSASRRLRRRPVHPLHPDQRRRRVPRPDVHHARDARHRRRDEPVGRGRRRAVRERARLVLAEMEDGMTSSADDRPAVGSRIVVVSAVMALVLIVRPGGLTGASSRSRGCVRRWRSEGLRRRVRRGRLAVRGEPRAARRRRGLGLRRLAGTRRRDQRERAATRRGRRGPRPSDGDDRRE